MGAGGILGRRLVGELARRGHDVRAATTREGAPGRLASIRYIRVDLLTGAGLEEACEGVESIVHSATAPTRAGEVDLGGLRGWSKLPPGLMWSIRASLGAT